MKKLLYLLVPVLLLTAVLAGCGSDPSNNRGAEGASAGEEDDAQAVSADARLKEFSADFYLYDEYETFTGDTYRYELVEEDGRYLLSESFCYEIETEVDPSVEEKVREIIAGHNLLRFDGTDDVTASLPVEYQPCSVSAVYTTGETLSFRMDGDPESKWATALNRLFRSEFVKAGYHQCAPDAENLEIAYFTLEFNVGTLGYEYGTIDVDGRDMLFCQIWDMAEDNLASVQFAGMEAGFLKQFSDKIEELNLQSLAGTDSAAISHTPEGYLDIHITYAGSRRLYAEYSGRNIPAAWAEVLDELKPFLDDYIAEHVEAESYEELSGIAEGSSTAVMYEFLENFFTPNRENRYYNFLAQAGTDLEEPEGAMAVTDYHSGIAGCVTGEVLKEIELGRMLYRFDQLYGQETDSWSPVYIEVFIPEDSARKEDGYREFYIELNDGTRTKPIYGSLKAAEEEGKQKIDYFWSDFLQE